MKHGHVPPARSRPGWRSLLGAAALAALLAGAGNAQVVTLSAVKSGPSSADVALSWTASGLSSFVVQRDTAPSMPGPTGIASLCAFEHTDPGAVRSLNDFYYSVAANPAGLAAEAGPDAVGGSAIGGAPTASGGAPPYTYDWTPPAGLSDAAAANPVANPTVDTLYTVLVADSGGCSATDTVMVTAGGQLLAADGGPDHDSPPLTCGYTARLQLGGAPTASGGTPPYLYQWTPTLGLIDDGGPEWDKPNPWLIPVDDIDYALAVEDSALPPAQGTDTVMVRVDKSLAHCSTFDRNIGNCGPDFDIAGVQWNPASGVYEDITFHMHDKRCKVIVMEIGDLW